MAMAANIPYNGLKPPLEASPIECSRAIGRFYWRWVLLGFSNRVAEIAQKVGETTHGSGETHGLIHDPLASPGQDV